MTQLTLIRNDANIIDLTLDVRRKSLLGIFSSVLSLVIAAVLVGPFQLGIIGLCSGIIVGRLILTIAYPQFVGNVLGIAFRDQVKGIVRPLALTVLLFTLALGLRPYVTLDNWFALICYSGLSVLVLGLVATGLGLTGGQRQHLIQRLEAAIGLQVASLNLHRANYRGNYPEKR